MNSTRSISLEVSLPTAFTEVVSCRSDPLSIPELEPLAGPSVHDVTSNVRQGAPSPHPPSLYDHHAALVSHTRTPIPDDPIYNLPAPDLAPRFVFKLDESSTDETTPVPTCDGTYCASPHFQPSVLEPSSPSPRIYFANSAITFVPPLSYDILDRDPNVKGVPRNYRAWMRTGRPKLDVEGVDRAEAKKDFLAMGLAFPRDGDSDSGDDIENDKRRKRKKRQAARAQIPRIQRPKRMARRLAEFARLKQTLPNTRVIDDDTEDAGSEVGSEVMVAAKNGKVTEKSDMSERRSSSTLLDADMAERPITKRKRSGIGKDFSSVIPTKTPRVDRRSYTKRFSRLQSNKEVFFSSNRDVKRGIRAQSSLSDLTPPPELPPSIDSMHTTNEQSRHPSPGPSHHISRRTVGDPSNSVSSNPTRSTQHSTSRPGHRAGRDYPSTPQPWPLQMRTFPASIPIIQGYPGFYRQYPLVTQFERDDPAGRCITLDDSHKRYVLGNWNAPRDTRDLYTPRYTKGSGNKKIALCPICYEDPARGGEGRQEWNHTKTSQHNYHMQYYHGISATRGAPFSPPIAQRTVLVARPQSNEKSEILQGKCHNCKQWIALEGSKIGELKVKELFWWKHAASCHKDSKISEETNIFIEDDAYRRLLEYEASTSGTC